MFDERIGGGKEVNRCVRDEYEENVSRTYNTHPSLDRVCYAAAAAVMCVGRI